MSELQKHIENVFSRLDRLGLQVKQAVAGYGRADTNQVQEMVRARLGLQDVPRPDDAADALAVAICHLHSHRLRSLYEEV